MFNLILSELRREIHVWWSYRLNAILEVVIYSVVFVLLMLIFQNMALQSGATYGIERQTSSIVGILVWYFCMRTMSQLPAVITEESETGTLETIMSLSVAPLSLLASRAVAMSAIRGLQTLVMAVIMGVLLGLPFSFSLWTPVIIILTLAGACGMGFIFAGVTLVYKQAATIASLVAMLSLFAAGALVPLNSLGTIFTVLKIIVPITWGTDILRQILIAGQASNYDMLGLAAQAAIMVSIGVIVFNIGLRRAKEVATLATY